MFILWSWCSLIKNMYSILNLYLNLNEQYRLFSSMQMDISSRGEDLILRLFDVNGRHNPFGSHRFLPPLEFRIADQANEKHNNNGHHRQNWQRHCKRRHSFVSARRPNYVKFCSGWSNKPRITDVALSRTPPEYSIIPFSFTVWW